MNTTSESLLQAIQLVSEKTNSRLQFDKTIRATIKEVQDIPSGQYRVENESGEFTAYSQNISHVFAVGDIVYVKIPQGDYSNKKIIEGLEEGSDISGLAAISKLQRYSTNIFQELFSGTHATGELAAANPGTIEDARKYHYYYGLLDSNGEIPDRIQSYYNYDNKEVISNSYNFNIFKSYMKKYTNLEITLEAFTRFNFSAKKGNYGVIINLWPSKKPEETNDPLPITQTFSAIEHFNGNIYGFTQKAFQNLVIQYVQGDYDAITIDYFEDDFEFEDQGTDKYDPSLNIELSNLSMYFVSKNEEIPYNIEIKRQSEKYSESANGEGEYQEIVLTPTLFYGATPIENSKVDWKWYIYKKDGVENTNYVYYNKTLGRDWVYIEDGEESSQFKIERDETTKEVKFIATIHKSDTEFWFKKILKVVATYNETSEYISPEETIQNPYIDLNFSVTGEATSDPKYITLNGEGSLGSRIEFSMDEFVPYWEFQGDNKFNSNTYNSTKKDYHIHKNHPHSWNIPNEVFSNYANRTYFCLVYKKKLYYDEDKNISGVYSVLYRDIDKDINLWDIPDNQVPAAPSYKPSNQTDKQWFYNSLISSLITYEEDNMNRTDISDKEYLEGLYAIRDRHYKVYNNITEWVYDKDAMIDRLEYTFVISYENDPYNAFEIPISGMDTFYYNNQGKLQIGNLGEQGRKFDISFPIIPNEENGKAITEIEVYWKDSAKLEDNLDGKLNQKISNAMIESIDSCSLVEKGQFYKISFTIKDAYNASLASGNYFTIRYKYNNSYHTQRHYINFLINGNQGTNGTGWYAVIEGNGILSLANKDINNCLEFNLEVYKGGELSGDYVIKNVAVIPEGEAPKGENNKPLATNKLAAADAINCNVFWHKEANKSNSTLFVNLIGYEEVKESPIELLSTKYNQSLEDNLRKKIKEKLPNIGGGTLNTLIAKLSREEFITYLTDRGVDEGLAIEYYEEREVIFNDNDPADTEDASENKKRYNQVKAVIENLVAESNNINTQTNTYNLELEYANRIYSLLYKRQEEFRQDFINGAGLTTKKDKKIWEQLLSHGPVFGGGKEYSTIKELLQEDYKIPRKEIEGQSYASYDNSFRLGKYIFYLRDMYLDRFHDDNPNLKFGGYAAIFIFIIFCF